MEKFEKDIWIHDQNENELINLKGCINIFKINKSVDYEGRYRLKFVYNKDSVTILYDKKINRDNMYDLVVNFIKPYDINNNEKPLTL
jgi:hypothetical protein